MIFSTRFGVMADGGRFELPVPLRVRRISSAVHSTALPPIRRRVSVLFRAAPTGRERRGSEVAGN
jgi:hypothetical protein